MDMFPCRFAEIDKVDLDDLRTYPKRWLNLDIRRLWLEAERRAGDSLFYMGFLWPSNRDGGHEKRVHKFCRELVKMFRGRFDNSDENRLKLLKWLFKFAEEVENQV